jgi:hypothetical protein
MLFLELSQPCREVSAMSVAASSKPLLYPLSYGDARFSTVPARRVASASLSLEPRVPPKRAPCADKTAVADPPLQSGEG